MFKKLFSIIFIFFFSFIFSQENEVINEEFPVFPICKLVPAKNQSICFNETIEEHIEKYFIFPDSAKDLGLQSVVNVFFEIDINGKVDKLFAKSSIVGVEFKDSESLNIANAIFEQAAMKIFDQLLRNWSESSLGKQNGTQNEEVIFIFIFILPEFDFPFI